MDLRERIEKTKIDRTQADSVNRRLIELLQWRKRRVNVFVHILPDVVS